uniref:J domain-containing protein n=1 Tax=Leptobrachium leishanense TaxID=445787 RepID=A0A8C5QXK1_9ANUR
MMLSRGLINRQVWLCTTRTQCCARTHNHSEFQDYYQVLGIERQASGSEIKKAFFIQSKKLHPDSDPSNPLLHSQFVRLSEAYNVLSKDGSRRQYDRFLDALKREHWVPGRDSSIFRESGPSPRHAPEDNAFYWAQFRGQTGVPIHQRKRQNKRLVWFCVLLMTGSMITHYMGFSILRKIHKDLIEEQQQRLLNIYNETKNTARAGTSLVGSATKPWCNTIERGHRADMVWMDDGRMSFFQPM